MSLEKIHTTCVYCGCGCGLFLHVEDGQVVGVSPSPSHPMSRGRLCIKGWLAHEFLRHPDRLRTPLIREGDRLRKATWKEALNLTHQRLSDLLDSHGPDSLAVLTSAKGTNEENYLWMKFARAALGTNNVDHAARLCHAPTLAGLGQAFGSGSMTNSIESLGQADVILVTGSNTTEQHPLVASYILEAQARGGTLMVLDPRRTQLAGLADIYVPTLPGSDVAWINAILNVIIAEGLVDREFVDARTEGFEQVREVVSRYTPEAVQEICGIPAQRLREIARIYAEAERSAIVYAMGITQHVTGTDNVQALANLALATGNLGRPGTGICPLRGHQNVQGACDMGALPDFYCGYQRVLLAREKFEKAWGLSLPEKPGLTAVELMAAAREGRIRGMVISGENPMVSYPDRERIKEALEALEFLVATDIFPTETTALADVVLPVASFAEKDGTFTSTERRVQRVRKATDPPGEALTEWQVTAELLSRFGIETCYQSASEVMEEIAALAPQYGGISYDRLGIEGLHWPCPDVNHPGTPILHGQAFSIGRGRFRAVDYRPPHEAPDQEYPFLLSTGRSLYHFHTGTMTRRVPLLDREVPGPSVEINPADARNLGIREANRVTLESRRGRVSARAHLTEGIPPGMLFMAFHFQEAPANQLTASALDPLSKMPGLKISAVRIRRDDQ
ncbi:MAG: formate dehydrogenase subunit alpha [Methanosarcinales archaeon]|nr:formate dehydrogenase subunit alpha [Methanosarcinales archaeon]